MPSDIITPPVIEDSQLIFDDKETISILTFFWPSLATDIGRMTVSNEARKFAQALLIAAIDGSYALGWMEALFASVSKPANLPALGKKLARNFVKHWWKHAKLKDLENVKIYDTVRETVARNFRSSISELLVELRAQVRLQPFVVTSVGNKKAWV